MDSRAELDVFVDKLCAALGLKSVKTRPRSEEDTDLAATSIHGRSVLSTENRDVLRVALEQDPRPRTIGELCSTIEDFVQDPAVEEVLAAAQRVAGTDPGRSLDAICRSGRTHSAGA
jgi:hypothetical protein